MKWRRKRGLGDYSAEIASHLELERERLREQGLDAAQAGHAAQRSFGNVTKAQERFYESRRWVAWDHLLADLRIAARGLRRSPAFTAVAVLTLALGIGINVTVFSLVQGLLLRPLPVAQPDQLAVLVFRQAGGPLGEQFSLPDLRDISARTRSVFSGVFGYMVLLDGISRGGGGQRILTNYVTGNYFATLGVRPYLGRLILPTEGHVSGADRVLVLSYSFWKTRFGGDRGLIGHTVQFNGQPITLVGVTPPAFHGVEPLADIEAYVPMNMITTFETGWPANLLENRVLQNALVLARLRPGITLAGAAAALPAVARSLALQSPATDRGLQLSLYAERDSRPNPEAGARWRRAAALFMALVGLVLLLACLNVANLFAVRASARQPELVLRAALGAGRLRIARHLLAESLILGLAGGAAGIVMVALAGGAISAIPTHSFVPFHLDFGLHAGIALYGLGAALLAGLLVGAIPAWRATRSRLEGVMRGQRHSAHASRLRLRELFVALQIAGSFAVLTLAFLFARSLANLQRQDLGFSPAGVVELALNPANAGYSRAQGQALYRALVPAVAALPGVQSVALADSAPLSDYYNNDNLKIADYTNPPGGALPLAGYGVVSRGYFHTLRIPVVAGRGFSASDQLGAPYVAIVNQAFARKYWPGADPLGKHFAKVSGATNPEYTVVGVAADSRTHSLTGPFAPYFYLPLEQNYDLSPLQVLLVRGAAPPGGEPARGPQAVALVQLMQSAASVVHRLAPSVPVFNEQSLPDSLNSFSAYLPAQAAAFLAAILGAVGLLLAVLGIYGVMSFTTKLRQREIGVRMALGARPQQVWRMLVWHGAAIVALGLAAGGLLALVTARFGSNFLVQVRYTDPLAYAGAGALLGLTALLACALPARRAAHLDPTQTLRQE